MPSYSYPAAFAFEAARNLRELATAGRLEATGAGAHSLITDLHEAARAMRQVLDQLAIAHSVPALSEAVRADALEAADELHQAGTAVDEASDRLSDAARAAKRVTSLDSAPPHEWVSVASLYGDDAAPALGVLEREGPEAAAVFLSQWDAGIETDDRAVAQHATSEHLLLSPGEQVVSFDAYTIVASPGRGSIAMYRLLDDVPSPGVLDAQDRYAITTPAPAATTETTAATETTVAAEPVTPEPPTRRSQRERQEARHVRRPEPDGSWFDPPTGGGAARGRGLGL